MERFDALDVIARTRGKVDMDSMSEAGGMLFPMWGWVTACFYLLEFVVLYFLHQEWGIWLWTGIAVVGIPLMVLILRKYREREHIRTRTSRLVLDYWIFAACAIGLGGFLFGFSGVYMSVENPMICLLLGIGAFITGEATRFRPMIVGGLVGAAIGLCAFLLQGDLWVWQTLCIVLVAIVSLIIPGYLFEKNGV